MNARGIRRVPFREPRGLLLRVGAPEDDEVSAVAHLAQGGRSPSPRLHRENTGERFVRGDRVESAAKQVRKGNALPTFTLHLKGMRPAADGE